MWDVGLNIPLWIVLLVTLAVLLYLYGTQPFRVWKDLGVSGPKPLPFFGNITQMFDKRVGICSTINQWQKTYGRLFGVYLFRKPVLIITDPDVVKEVFVKNFSNFSDRHLIFDVQQQIVDKGVFFAKGLNWRRIRQIMSPIFSSRKLKLVTDHINMISRKLSGSMKKCAEDGIPVEVKTIFGDFILDIVCGTSFGLNTNSMDNSDHPFIKHAKSLLSAPKLIRAVLALTAVFPIFEPLVTFMGIGFFKKSDINFFEKNISAIIQERQSDQSKHTNNDFLQLLIEAEAYSNADFVGDKKLTNEEIVAQSILFIIAGYETTYTTLQFVCYELAKNHEIQSKVMKEIQDVLGDTTEPDYDKCKSLKYMEATIYETLRMHPPVQLLTRLVKQKTNLNGLTVPANSIVLIPPANLGSDPEFFQDPDFFNPDRFLNENKQQINPFTFLSFGQGPRSCIGMRLAMVELKIALVHILRKVRLVDATPNVLEIDDHTGVPVPRIPIRLHVRAIK